MIGAVSETRAFASVPASDVADHVLENVEKWNKFWFHKSADEVARKRHMLNAILCRRVLMDRSMMRAGAAE